MFFSSASVSLSPLLVELTNQQVFFQLLYQISKRTNSTKKITLVGLRATSCIGRNILLHRDLCGELFVHMKGRKANISLTVRSICWEKKMKRNNKKKPTQAVHAKHSSHFVISEKVFTVWERLFMKQPTVCFLPAWQMV